MLKGVPALYVARTFKSELGPTTSHTQPEPCIESAVWNMRFRRAEREPNDMSIFVRRVFGMVGSTVPSDCGSYHSV